MPKKQKKIKAQKATSYKTQPAQPAEIKVLQSIALALIQKGIWEALKKTWQRLQEEIELVANS